MKYKNHIRTLAVFYGNKYIFLQFQTSKKKKKRRKNCYKTVCLPSPTITAGVYRVL